MLPSGGGARGDGQGDAQLLAGQRSEHHRRDVQPVPCPHGHLSDHLSSAAQTLEMFVRITVGREVAVGVEDGDARVLAPPNWPRMAKAEGVQACLPG